VRIWRNWVCIGSAVPLTSAVGASGVIVLAALSAPVLQSTVGYPAGEPLYDVLFAICHQYPERSLWIGGHPCGLCARCLGGYLGVATIGVLVLARLRDVRATCIFLAGIMLLVLGVGDAVIKVLTSHDGPNLWRLFTGGLGGAGIAAALATPWQYFRQKT
jgi:uncharacterized membrane protein